MTSLADKRLAVGVIVLSTGLMQLHSVPFWQKFTGSYYSGIAFSIALEGAMLWLWYVNRQAALRVVIAGILISGPWYQVSVPVFEDIGTVTRSAAMAESYREEIDQLQASLSTFEENSKKSRRASDRVDPTQARLDAARENFRKEISAAEKTDAPWRLYGVALMQALAFFGVMLTQIEAVKYCRVSGISGSFQSGVSKISTISEKIEISEIVFQEIETQLKRYASAAAFCEATGLTKSDVSKVRNGRKISDRKLKEMAEKLGVGI